MKRYIFDRLLFLLCGIGIVVFLLFYYIHWFTIILVTLVLLSWGHLCWRILVLPFDLLHDKEIKTVYFADVTYIEKYDFSKRYCVEWKFYFESSQTITLLVPVSANEQELELMKTPKRDEQVKITYYRFSKILIDWQTV